MELDQSKGYDFLAWATWSTASWKKITFQQNIAPTIVDYEIRLTLPQGSIRLSFAGHGMYQSKEWTTKDRLL